MYHIVVLLQLLPLQVILQMFQSNVLHTIIDAPLLFTMIVFIYIIDKWIYTATNKIRTPVFLIKSKIFPRLIHYNSLNSSRLLLSVAHLKRGSIQIHTCISITYIHHIHSTYIPYIYHSCSLNSSCNSPLKRKQLKNLQGFLNTLSIKNLKFLVVFSSLRIIYCDHFLPNQTMKITKWIWKFVLQEKPLIKLSRRQPLARQSVQHATFSKRDQFIYMQICTQTIVYIYCSIFTCILYTYRGSLPSSATICVENFINY